MSLAELVDRALAESRRAWLPPDAPDVIVILAGGPRFNRRRVNLRPCGDRLPPMLWIPRVQVDAGELVELQAWTEYPGRPADLYRLTRDREAVQTPGGRIITKLPRYGFLPTVDGQPLPEARR